MSPEDPQRELAVCPQDREAEEVAQVVLLELLPSLAALLSGLPLLKDDLRFDHERCHFGRNDNAFDIGARDNADMVLLFELHFLAMLSIMCIALPVWIMPRHSGVGIAIVNQTKSPI